MKLSWIRRMLFTAMQGGTFLIAVDACRQHCDALVPGVMRDGARFAIESLCMTCRSAVLEICHPLWAGPVTVQHITAFATHPGSVSRESISASVRNGFFSGALINRLLSQGKTTDIRQLLGGVRDDVSEATGGRQQPFIAGSLNGDLCLVVPSDELEPVRPHAPPPQTSGGLSKCLVVLTLT